MRLRRSGRAGCCNTIRSGCLQAHQDETSPSGTDGGSPDSRKVAKVVPRRGRGLASPVSRAVHYLYCILYGTLSCTATCIRHSYCKPDKPHVRHGVRIYYLWDALNCASGGCFWANSRHDVSPKSPASVRRGQWPGSNYRLGCSETSCRGGCPRRGCLWRTAFEENKAG